MLATLDRPSLTAAQAAEWERCKGDIIYFINAHVWTFDPRPEASPNHLPFKLYPFQEDHVNGLEDSYRKQMDRFDEKSRDMGITFDLEAWLAHHWLFDEAFHALMGSRKEELVDRKGDSATLFWKLDYMLDRLPTWMLQHVGYDHGDKSLRQHMLIQNPSNGNTITGESANPDFSRQGRYSVIFLDEFPFWPWARSVWTATADSTRCRLVVGTAEPGSFAKELRYSSKIAIHTWHWRLHPKKDEAWYEREKERRTAEDVAKELDINWEGSVRGLVYGDEWLAIPKGEFPYVPGWPLFTSWDFGLDGTPLIWWQLNPQTRKYRVVDCYSNSNKTIDFYVPWTSGVIKSGLPYGYAERDIAQISSHAGWPGATHFGDPDVEKRNLQTGKSTRELLAAVGIHVQTRPDVNSFEARWQRTKLFLRRVEGINMPACNALYDAMTNARFPERREGSQATSESTKPIHDWTSHYRTAVEYMAVNVPDMLGQPAVRATRQKSAWEMM